MQLKKRTYAIVYKSFTEFPDQLARFRILYYASLTFIEYRLTKFEQPSRQPQLLQPCAPVQPPAAPRATGSALPTPQATQPANTTRRQTVQAHLPLCRPPRPPQLPALQPRAVPRCAPHPLGSRFSARARQRSTPPCPQVRPGSLPWPPPCRAACTRLRVGMKTNGAACK